MSHEVSDVADRAHVSFDVGRHEGDEPVAWVALLIEDPDRKGACGRPLPLPPPRLLDRIPDIGRETQLRGSPPRFLECSTRQGAQSELVQSQDRVHRVEASGNVARRGQASLYRRV